MINPIFFTINPEIQKQAAELFSNMGIDMNTAINFLLYQCILNGGLPISANCNENTLKSMMIEIPNNPNGQGYDPMAWFKGFNK